MNTLFEIISRETAECGVLPFARFMELALYCPVHGYYETNKDNPGRHGDFYTSAGVGELFGRLLAFQFAEWLEQVRTADGGLRIVEAGAHDGRLAKDILGWLQLKRPQLFEQIEYWVIEPSVRRQAWQKETLKCFGRGVRWFSGFPSLLQEQTRHTALRGIIFSNELLDAMPVHRFGWEAQNKRWVELGVTVDDGKFVWARIPDTIAPRRDFDPSSLLHLPASLLAVLPDGYIIETCPAAEDWWRKAAQVLGQGKLLAIDYGLTASELFSPARSHGTLRAYFRHHVGDDLLANVGQQDLTAHVNFSAIQIAGEACGLATEQFSTQSQFLTRIFQKTLREKPSGELVASKSDGGGSEGGWTSAHARQFQTLTHPEHLGSAFRVLVQSR